MTLHSLTETFVEKAKPPPTGEVFYRDRNIRGFALRVNWGGTKSFIVEGRVNGRVRRITLGRHPVMSVAKARAEALKTKGSIADGIDPTTVETGAVTFAALAADYIDYAKQHGKKTWRQYEQTLALYIPKGWNSRRLSDISRNDVVKLHGHVGEHNGEYSANRLIALVRAMFNYAIDELKTFKGENPAARVTLFKEKTRERFLSPDELVRVNEALLQEPEPWRSYFPLVLLTGTRRMELLAAKWENVDLTARTLKLTDTKNGRTLLLPLPLAAVAILEALPSRGASEWLFPSYGKTGHVTEPKTAWDRIRERAKVLDVRIHDLRRTLGSWLAGAGFSLPMIGKALGHRSPSSTAIYARLDLDPVRVMLESNATAMFGSGK
jgi:integrase